MRHALSHKSTNHYQVVVPWTLLVVPLSNKQYGPTVIYPSVVMAWLVRKALWHCGSISKRSPTIHSTYEFFPNSLCKKDLYTKPTVSKAFDNNYLRDARFFIDRNGVNVAVSRERCLAITGCMGPRLDTIAKYIYQFKSISPLCAFEVFSLRVTHLIWIIASVTV